MGEFAVAVEGQGLRCRARKRARSQTKKGETTEKHSRRRANGQSNIQEERLVDSKVLGEDAPGAEGELSR